MTFPIHIRAVRPDGTEAARGPHGPDVIADAVKAGGAPWHILALKGWRVETVRGEALT